MLQYELSILETFCDVLALLLVFFGGLVSLAATIRLTARFDRSDRPNDKLALELSERMKASVTLATEAAMERTVTTFESRQFLHLQEVLISDITKQFQRIRAAAAAEEKAAVEELKSLISEARAVSVGASQTERESMARYETAVQNLVQAMRERIGKLEESNRANMGAIGDAARSVYEEARDHVVSARYQSLQAVVAAALRESALRRIDEVVASVEGLAKSTTDTKDAAKPSASTPDLYEESTQTEAPSFERPTTRGVAVDDVRGEHRS